MMRCKLLKENNQRWHGAIRPVGLHGIFKLSKYHNQLIIDYENRCEGIPLSISWSAYETGIV